MRIALALTCLTCFAVSSARAEELHSKTLSDAETAHVIAVLSADKSYKPLTTWEKVKLGAAYFTNPQRVRSLEIVYEYNPMAFVTGEQQETLDNLAIEGKILCTFKQDNKSAPVKAVSCDSVPNFPEASAAFKIISSEPSLLKKQPTGVLVAEDIPELRPRPKLDDNQLK